MIRSLVSSRLAALVLCLGLVGLVGCPKAEDADKDGVDGKADAANTDKGDAETPTPAMKKTTSGAGLGDKVFNDQGDDVDDFLLGDDDVEKDEETEKGLGDATLPEGDKETEAAKDDE